MKNNKLLKRFLCLIAAVSFVVLGSFNVFAEGQETLNPGMDETPYRSYTYWTDFGAEEKTHAYSKPMYEVKKVINQNEMGADSNSRINDVFADEKGNLLVLDSGNSKVYILNNEYVLTSVIENIQYNGEVLSFKDAKGIFAKEDIIYIADTENGRVIVIDINGNVQKMLYLPKSNLIPSGFKYRPIKVVVDSDNYTYIASDGSYYGAILYSPEMEFLGFFGANTVKATTADVIKNLWNKIFTNDVKRAADAVSLPYTFTDMVLGPKDFIYTSTGRNGEETIQYGQICRFNPGGKDVLGAGDFNFADKSVGSFQRQLQVQDLCGLDVDDNGFFYALDSTYGRIFWYDKDCNLLSVFGGSFSNGTQQGTFSLPTGIACQNDRIIVSDSEKNSITVFKRTDYGQMVYNAQNITLSGDFALAKEKWEAVIKLDVNNQLAYRGLAKAYYDINDNETAMKYAKLGMDRDTYAKAFENKRSEMLENNFVLLAFIAFVVIIGIVVFCFYIKKKGIVLIKNTNLKNALSSVAHPVESFRLVKEKGQGSVAIATIILVLFYIITVLNDTKGGFAFTYFDSANYNAFYVLISTVGLVVLWSISNWLVCTLAGGIGTLKEIYIVSCYSVIPLLFGRLLNLVLTHILVPKEAAFLGMFVTICTLYTIFMLAIGVMRIHDYEFGKFIGTTIFTIIGMLIVVFLIFLIFLLAQQVYGWVSTLVIEFIYR